MDPLIGKRYLHLFSFTTKQNSGFFQGPDNIRLTYDQLLQAFNAVEEKKITGAEARDIVAAFDKNKDGTIKFDEFVEVKHSF